MVIFNKIFPTSIGYGIKRRSYTKKNKWLWLSLSAFGLLAFTAQVADAEEVTPANTLAPIYRVYNPNSGEHLHTLDSGERDNLMGIGWVYEGISMQIDGSGNDLYRVYNPNSGEHFYTKDSGEQQNLVANGWHAEGVAWKTPESGEAVYRVYNPNARDAGSHHYTLEASERDGLVSQGWKNEGTSWFVSGGASTALSMILGSKGINADPKTMQDNLPMYPANPDGQKGDVYTGQGFGWVIEPNALATYGQTFGRNTVDISGESTTQIINRVLSGQPVLYYGFSSYQVDSDTNRNHCKVIAGYQDGKFLVYDPLYYSADDGAGSGGKNMKYDNGARAWITVGQYNAEKDGRAITIN